MTSALLHEQAKKYLKNHPDIKPGYTLRVHEKINEGEKERVQIFEGLAISVHKGHTPADSTFTVRRVVSGIGVEKIFSLHSPNVVKIEVKKVAKVRRSKLFFLRGRRGKSARLSERFTTAEEFAQAVGEDPAKEEENARQGDTEIVEATEEETEEKDDATGKKDESEVEESQPAEAKKE